MKKFWGLEGVFEVHKAKGSTKISFGWQVPMAVGFLIGLLWCSHAHAGLSYRATYDACDFSIGVQTPLNPTVQAAKDLIQTSCTSCHRPGGSGAAVNNDPMDYKQLLATGFLVPGDPAKSRMYDATSTASPRMPKGGPFFTADQKKVLYDYIKNYGDVDWNSAGKPVSANYISPIQVRDCIRQFARNVDGRKRKDGLNWRFFDLSPEHNSGDSDRFQTLGDALDVTLNQIAIDVTRGQAAVSPYQSVKLDTEGIIRGVFLPTIVKNAREFDILTFEDYKFAIDFAQGNFFNRLEREEIQEIEADLQDLTGLKQPFVDASFFVNESLIVKYYEYLGINIKRQKLQDIERAINVNADKAIGDLEIDASAIRRSGVSLFNRMIHRFNADYTFGGAFTSTSYWKTYDVVTDKNRFNFFSFPLGPDTVKFDFKTDKVFDFAAGEQFFQMPNKFLLYTVALKNGTLLREADTHVAFNPSRSKPAFSVDFTPGAIVTGGGCMECHAGGANYFTDQLVSFVSGGGAGTVSAAEHNAIRQIFPAQTAWNASFNSFNTSFVAAHTQVIKRPSSRVAATEPVTQALSSFLNYQSLEAAAALFGLTRDQFVSCIEDEAAILRALGLKPGQATATVSRTQLDNEFADIVEACGLGKQILFKVKKGGGGGSVVPPVRPTPPPRGKSCDYSFKNNSKYYVNFVTDFGKWGATSVALWPSDNKDFTFLNEDSVDGTITSFSFSARTGGSWGSKQSVSGTSKVSGCRNYEFYDDPRGRPNLR